jgi:hypothetical protein
MSREHCECNPAQNTEKDMTNIPTSSAYRAQLPEGYALTGSGFRFVPVLAQAAALRYKGRTLKEPQWGAMLRRMRFAPQRREATKAKLSALYTAPLSFEQWCDLFEQLMAEHVLATKYQHLR